MTSAGAWLVALAGWTALIAFYRLDGGAGFEPTDCWVGQTAREMLEAGDWLIPRFSGETRMQKSPGAYWAVMLTSLARGQPVDEVSTRIPNAVAAVVTVLTVFWLTRRIAGDRAAVFAGFAASSSALILYWSHRGASDLGLTACTTLSLACLWVALESSPPGWRRNTLLLGGYLAAGVGMLYKMPMPLVCVGLPAFCYVLLFNRWRLLADRWHLVGLGLFLLSWAGWAVAVYFHEPDALAKWRVEFLDRFTGQLPNVAGQRRWPYLFFYFLPAAVFTLPYTLSLPAALSRALRPPPGVRRDGVRLCLIWVASLFIFFTASAGKELRYFLPALPPLFVLLGVELSMLFDPQRARRWARVRAATSATLAAVPAGLALGAWGLYRWHQERGRLELVEWGRLWPAYAVTAAVLLAGLSLAAWLYRRGRTEHSFAALVGTMWGSWLWAWPMLMPQLVSQRTMIDFAHQLRDRLPVELRPHLRQVGSQDSRVIWYSDVRFPRIIDQLELLSRQGGRRSLEHEIQLVALEMVRQLRQPEPVLLVASRQDYVRFLTQAPKELAARGEAMPPVHLWLESRLGPPQRHLVVFSQHPPPWPEPRLDPPDPRLSAAGVVIPQALDPRFRGGDSNGASFPRKWKPTRG